MITGASGGIGRATALALAAVAPSSFFAIRESGQQARSCIAKERTGHDRAFIVDLAFQADVLRAAGELTGRLDDTTRVSSPTQCILA